MSIDKGTVDDIKSLVPETQKKRKKLKPKPRKSGIPSTASAVKADLGNGQGIASPITERPGSREYHDTLHEYRTSDGFFTVVIRNVKTINGVDASGQPAAWVLDDPPPPEEV